MIKFFRFLQINRVLIFSIAIISLLAPNMLFGQATYESNTSGDWSTASSWVLSAGSPLDNETPGTPDGNDHVIIKTGHNITQNSAVTVVNVTINGILNSTNPITITGNWTNNGVFNSSSEVNFANTNSDQTIGGSSVTSFSTLRMSKAEGFNLLLENNVRIKNELIFADPGLVVLEANNLIFADGATVSLFGPGKMVRQTGTLSGGAVIKEGNTEADFTAFTFPIGTGDLYTPALITSLEATYAVTSSVSIKAVSITPVDAAKIINRYFSIESSGISNLLDAGLTFNYDQSDEAGNPNKVRRYEGATPNDVTGYFYNLTENKFGTNPASGNQFLDGDWYLEKPAGPENYYSYQSGNWSDPNIWTTDPTGATLMDSPGAGGPGNLDHVTILSGRSVVMDENSKTLSDLTLNSGGILNIGTSTGHNFGTVEGQGTLKIASTTIPVGNYTDFLSAAGGTFEYNTSGSFTLPLTFSTYNNLTINLGDNSNVVTQLHHLTLNGKLVVTKGIFRINDNSSTAALSLIVKGDVEVASTGQITVGTGNTNGWGEIFVPGDYDAYNTLFHQVKIHGNLLNNGTIRFTNQATPVYDKNSVTGAASVYFSGLSDKTATLNGTTDFYNLIIDKGSDRTYILTINSSNEAYFRLFGRNNLPGRGNTPGGVKDPNPEIRKALWIKNGTLRLTGQILIPTLTEGGENGPDGVRDPNGDYHIPSNGALWIDGAGVRVYSTADNVSETTVGGITATGVNTTNDYQAWSIYGMYKITAGYFDSRTSAGLIFWSIGYDSKMEIAGGKVRLNQIRAGDNGGKVSFLQTGGELELNGRNGARNNGSGAIGFNDPAHVFIMSGGNIIINDVISNDITKNAIEIGSSAANHSVTGGTITINLKGFDDHHYGIRSTSNLHNLVINRTDGTNVVKLSSPLVISNNLTINTGAALEGNDFNLTIKGNFTNNGNYGSGWNTTTFNGSTSSQQIVLNTGSITGFNHLVFNNTFPGGGIAIGGTKVTKEFDVLGNLELVAGSLNDGGFTLKVSGNVTNSISHSGTGRIKMINSAGAKNIVGNGNGVFGNLELDDTDGFTMTARQTVTNSLILTNGVLNIGSNNLSLGNLAVITVSNPGASKMIKTSGNKNDGGVSKAFASSTGTFLFPVGTDANYTPIEASITATTYGTVVARPVALQHPVITNPANYADEVLKYYWRLTDTGFSGISAVALRFDYAQEDVTGSDGSYVSGKYSESTSTWTSLLQAFPASNYFTYTHSSSITGEYTAGNINAFGGVTLFESITSGSWNSPSTWRTLQNNVVIENPATVAPDKGNPVRIKNGHTVTISGSGDVLSGSLEIETSGVLDLGTSMDTGNHNFGSLVGEDISGNGKLRISSSLGAAKFPAGDFSNFIAANGGTVEFYTTSGNFTLPKQSIAPTNLALTSYNNLMVTPTGGIITMPNQDLVIHNDLTINGASGIANISSASAGNITVGRDLTISGGTTLLFQNGVGRIVNVGRNVTVAPGSSFTVNNINPAVANMLNVSGNLVNNGTFDFFNGSGNSYADVTFKGPGNNSLSGTGGITEFNRLILNKGTGQVATLEVTSSDFTLSGVNSGATKSLDLQNGIFHYNGTDEVILSSGNNGSNYYIPSTSQLHISSGSFKITSTGTNAGLVLSGKLKISGTGLLSVEGITPSVNNENYIEVAGAGAPSIEMMGGALTVGAQIRRATSVATGSLNYIQSGGTVSIGTQSSGSTTRGMFEVLNIGSNFNMSGGTIILSRSNGSSSFASFYLSPTTHSATGGTIQIGNTDTPVNQTFLINTEKSIYNFTVHSANSPVAILDVNPLKVKGNINIQGGTLNSNNLDLFVSGDFNNNGIYIPGTNTTHFNGSVNQTIGGAAPIEFNKLNITNTFAGGTVSLNSNILVNNELHIFSGTLNDNGRIVTVKGNIFNAANHTSGTGGKILLNGGIQQTIDGSGAGIFGNVEINNFSHVRALSSLTINGIITLTAGLLNIDKFLLTLGTSASFSGTAGELSMIKTNGVVSDAGVLKNFAAGPFNFTFPMGTSGKYTPVQYIATSNAAAGSIKIKPIVVKHPSTTDPSNTELNYYWDVDGTGFSGLVVKHIYSYNQADANGNGNENNYVAARLIEVPSPTWFKGQTDLGTVNSTANTITIDGGSSALNAGVDFITGDYTAGEVLEFGPLTPYISTAIGGNWNLETSWEGGQVPPSGSKVTIVNGAQINIPTGLNSLVMLSVELSGNAKLDLLGSFGHSFGKVTGTGKMVLSSGNFPAGDYTEFTKSGGGTVEFIGTNYTLPNLTTYNNLVLNPTGQVNMGNTNIVVNNDFKISAGTLINFHNKNLELKGSWWNNGAYTPQTGIVTFSGSGTQIVKGKSTTDFYSININKPSGDVSLDTVITISGNLGLTKGKIISTDATSKVIINDNATADQGNSTSFVDGKVTKLGNDEFTFPVGDANIWARLGISDLENFNSSTQFTCQYFGQAFSNIVVTSEDDLEVVSGVEYWDLSRDNSVTAACKVQLYWEDNLRSGISDLEGLNVAHYDTFLEKWENKGGVGISQGNSGSILSDIQFNKFSPVTLGADVGSANPLPIVFQDFSIKILDGKNAALTWKMSEIEAGAFTVQRSTDGINYENLRTMEVKTSIDNLYHFIDYETSNGRSYYRIYFEGSSITSYSSIESIQINSNESGAVAFIDRVYPNPSDGNEIVISTNLVNKEVAIRITEVRNVDILKNGNSFTTDLSGKIRLSNLGLKPGLYILSVTSSYITVCKKIIVE